ncbi:hypothetical protein B7494_g7425 [Chlorociboria aeruginascens]|nr:hypothetical protein B7494_g7425 [Chlorociboria aeruginascens]
MKMMTRPTPSTNMGTTSPMATFALVVRLPDIVVWGFCAKGLWDTAGFVVEILGGDELGDDRDDADEVCDTEKLDELEEIDVNGLWDLGTLAVGLIIELLDETAATCIENRPSEV